MKRWSMAHPALRCVFDAIMCTKPLNVNFLLNIFKMNTIYEITMSRFLGIVIIYLIIVKLRQGSTPEIQGHRVEGSKNL